MHLWRKPMGMLAAAMVLLAACSGGGGGGGGDSNDPVTSGLSGNFVADISTMCPSTATDTLALRKIIAVGKTVTIGIQVTDCDASLGIYGVNFDIHFDPTVMKCAGRNPCVAGTLLGSPLATSAPQCVCDDTTGELLGTFTKKYPGTNETISPGGSKDIVQFTMTVIRAGAGRVDFLGMGSVSGTALVTLTGGNPVPVGALDYGGGLVTGQ